MNRGRIARYTLAACIGLILAALWIRVAVEAGRWVAVLLLGVALGLAAIVAAVMATAGTAVVRHGETYQRAIERTRRREITR